MHMFQIDHHSSLANAEKNIFSDFIDCVGYYTALGYNVIHGVLVFVFFTFA